MPASAAIAEPKPVLVLVENNSNGHDSTTASTTDGWGEHGHTCGARTLVKRLPGRMEIRPALCDRWACRVCGPRRVAWLQRQIRHAIDHCALSQFWTLTLRTTTCTPLASFTLLQQSWNRLRTVLSKHHGPFSYVWTIEMTKDGYAHLHVLTTLEVSRHALAQRWHQASGGSFVVDVQAIRSGGITGYVAKSIVQEARRRQEPAWTSLQGKRLFGRSRDVPFEPFRRKGNSEEPWQVASVPYREMAERLKAVAPVNTERNQGVPSLMVDWPEPPTDDPAALPDPPLDEDTALPNSPAAEQTNLVCTFPLKQRCRQTDSHIIDLGAAIISERRKTNPFGRSPPGG